MSFLNEKQQLVRRFYSVYVGLDKCLDEACLFWNIFAILHSGLHVELELAL